MKDTINKSEQVYDLIIIGAGASGLFAGASLSKPLNGLILEKSSGPGKKLLMTGGGQCNLTRSDSIKDFISHYGDSGRRIRSVLYRFNNLAVMDFFHKQGVRLFEREDGKIFPESLKAMDILSALVRCCWDNGFKVQYSSPVTAITETDRIYTVHCGNKKYKAKKLIVAAGGCSYPTSGSDGKIFTVLADLGIEIISPKPALVPVHVEDYPYGTLSGISVPEVAVNINGEKRTAFIGDLLFTHNCFSGPVVLNASRYALKGAELRINYFPKTSLQQLLDKCAYAARGNRKQLSTLLHDILNESSVIPKRMIDLICLRVKVDSARKSSAVSRSDLSSVIGVLTDDRFVISDTGGFNSAMVTAGGVSLDEIDLKTLESKKYPGIYFAGEVLDVDGDTGGYNLQFAFSSAYAVAEALGITSAN